MVNNTGRRKSRLIQNGQFDKLGLKNISIVCLQMENI